MEQRISSLISGSVTLEITNTPERKKQKGLELRRRVRENAELEITPGKKKILFKAMVQGEAAFTGNGTFHKRDLV